jgi:hypothetical protein
MDQDKESMLETIRVFTDDILDDMTEVGMFTRKADLMAYIKAWKVNLQTIKAITKL